jgi:hypothetical protein
LTKFYILDKNSGVYESTLELICHFLKYDKTYALQVNFIESLLENLKNPNNSVILVRGMETSLKILEIINKEKNSENFIKAICSKFFDLDTITVLAILDVLEKDLKEGSVLNLIIKEINLFQLLSLGENVEAIILRKVMYTLSKLYAKTILNDIIITKNFLGISLQYYEDNKDNYFIMSVLLNIFHNKEIFNFLMDPNNNLQIDFQTSIIDILVENFFNHDPKVKLYILEIISILGVSCNLSLLKEQFFKKLIYKLYYYETEKVQISEKDLFSFLLDRLYKDFKTHDYEEYEEQFLGALLSNITNNFRFDK